MSKPLIEIRGLSKRYLSAAESEWALRDISITIERGEMVAIKGTSGSGKTTLLNLIGGLDRDYQGELIFEGRDRSIMTEKELSQLRNQEIGFIFQHFSLLDHLTVLDNVLLPSMLAPKKVSDRVRPYLNQPVDRALELLERVGLASKRDVSPTTLSGGQKQRVAIARALFFNPHLLLCDEPTGSLDTHTGQQIITLFQDLNQAGYTVVMITHEDRVSSAAQRVITLEDGQVILESASSGEDSPREPAQRELQQGEPHDD